MKYLLLFALIISSLFSEIKWEKDFNTAQKKAMEENKPILVFIERLNPPCRWCEKMKNTTLKDKKIQDIINSNFIAVKVAREKKEYPPSLKAKYVPTTFFLTNDGKLIGKSVGYWDVEDFKTDLLYVIKRSGN